MKLLSVKTSNYDSKEQTDISNKLKIALRQANMTLMPCLYLYLSLLDGSHSSLNLISPKIWTANPTIPEINTLLV